MEGIHILNRICVLLVVFYVSGVYVDGSVVLPSDRYILQSIDGYIPNENYVCPGNDIGTGHFTFDISKCKEICDAHILCAAFQFSIQMYGSNCWIKSLCENFVRDYGRWKTYIKESGKGCTFDSIPGHALYGENDITVTNVELNGCKNRCLRDTKCLSFDYNNETQTCFISYQSKETSEFFGPHSHLTYFQKRCGEGLPAVSKEILHSSQGSVKSLKNGHCVNTFGPYGGLTGTQFSYERNIFQNITEIQVGHSTYIKTIAIKYGSLPAIKYGGYAYSTSTTIFAADEYIVEVQGKSGTLMDQLTFITNQRTMGPYGSDGGHPFRAFGEGHRLLYISGTYSGNVNSMALHFEC